MPLFLPPQPTDAAPFICRLPFPAPAYLSLPKAISFPEVRAASFPCKSDTLHILCKGFRRLNGQQLLFWNLSPEPFPAAAPEMALPSGPGWRALSRSCLASGSVMQAYPQQIRSLVKTEPRVPSVEGLQQALARMQTERACSFTTHGDCSLLPGKLWWNSLPTSELQWCDCAVLNSRLVCVSTCVLSRVWLFATPWTISPPGSYLHRTSQARVLEWVAISFSRGSSQYRDRTEVLQYLHWHAGSLPLEPLGKPKQQATKS